MSKMNKLSHLSSCALIAVVGCSSNHDERASTHRAVELIDAVQIDAVPAVGALPVPCPHGDPGIDGPCYLSDAVRQARRDGVVDYLRMSVGFFREACRLERSRLVQRIDADAKFPGELIDYSAELIMPAPSRADFNDYVRNDVKAVLREGLRICVGDPKAPPEWVVRQRFETLRTLRDEQLSHVALLQPSAKTEDLITQFIGSKQ